MTNNDTENVVLSASSETEKRGGSSVQRMVRREAHIYPGESYVRIFRRGEGTALADIHTPDMDTITVDNADIALSQLGLRRRTNWQPREWGFAAEVTHHA